MQIAILIFLACTLNIASTYTLQLPTGSNLGLPGAANPDGMGIPGMPPMDEKEMAEFMNFLGEFDKYYRELPPEQRDVVDKGARYDLIVNNINPDTFQPLSPAERQKLETAALKDFEQAEARLRATDPATSSPAPGDLTPSLTDEQKPEIKPEQQADCSLITTHSKEQVSCLLQNAITHIEIIRQKLALLTADVSILQERLNTIIFYLKSLNKPEHLPRLASETFDRLYTLIAKLTNILKAEESHIITLHEQAESSSKNPYDILGLPYSATQEAIDQRYAQKQEEYNPETIEKNLESAGLPSEKIARRLRQTKIHLADIEDAYDRLSNPELRYQIDRFYKTDREQREALFLTTEQATEQLDSALESLIQEGFITELEKFFERYEPTELNRRKQMDRAESQRHEELQAIERIVPTTTQQTPYNRYHNEPNPYATNNSNLGFNPFSQPYTPPAMQAPFNPPSAKPTASNNDKKKTEPAKKPATKSAEKKEASKKNADDKKAEKPKEPVKTKNQNGTKPKPKADTLESISTEFVQQLTRLDKTLETTKSIITAPAHKDIIQGLNNSSASAPSGFDENLNNFVTQTISNPVLKQHADLAKFMPRVKKIKAQDALRPVWDEYYQKHQSVYENFGKLYTLRENRMPMSSETRAPLSFPWTTITELNSYIKTVRDTFAPKKPAKDKNKDKAKEKGKDKDAEKNKQKNPPQLVPAGKKLIELDSLLSKALAVIDSPLNNSPATISPIEVEKIEKALSEVINFIKQHPDAAEKQGYKTVLEGLLSKYATVFANINQNKQVIEEQHQLDEAQRAERIKAGLNAITSKSDNS